METTIEIAARDSRTRYIDAREAWRELARNKANTSQEFIRYTLTRAFFLIEKIGLEAAQTWALRKLREGFTPSATRGRAALEAGLKYEKAWGYLFTNTRSTYINGKPDEEQAHYYALANFLYDEIRMEG